MAKTLCKWKKREIHRDFETLIPLVDKPKFICKDCLRLANKKEHLCKGSKLP